MEWGTPVKWGRFLLFCVPQRVKTKETNPTRPGSSTPCKQALRSNISYLASLEPYCERELHPDPFEKSLVKETGK